MERPNVVLGIVGTQLDRGSGPSRWNSWRPTVDLCRHEDLLVGRLELLVGKRAEELTGQIVEDIAAVSPETEVCLHSLELDDPWDFEEVYGALLDFAQSQPFDPELEDYLIHVTTGTHVEQICWFLLTESRQIPGNLLQSSPPKGRSSEGLGTYRVIDLDLSRYDRIAQRFHRQHETAVSFLKEGIETRNATFNRLIDRIEHVAVNSDAPMLLTGPTGAGKSSLARRIYELKLERRRLAGPFVEVNCATLRGDAAMSTLFGHRRGAFTGAARDRDGLLLSAHGGLLFLDEIGDLGLDEQTMLLRALEEGRFLPMGADAESSSDFQLIAGTNRDLKRRIADGEFRDDLLARIDIWSFELPGLADRREDIEPNLDFELEQFERKDGTRVRFNREARERFLQFALSPGARWPANFRDFNAALTRMATLAPAGRITVEVVGEEVERLRRRWQGSESAGDAQLLEVLGDRWSELDLFDRLQLEAVVGVCRRHRSLSAAGRELFAQSRARRKTVNDADRLRKYLARFGLSWGDLIAVSS